MDGHGLTASASRGLNLGAPSGTATAWHHLTGSVELLKGHHLTGSGEIVQQPRKPGSGRPWTASLGLALEAPRGTVQHASETGKPQQDSSPTSQTRSAKKLSNATFWWPKERWNSTVQNAPPHQKPTSRQPMRNNQTPPRNEPKPAKTAEPKPAKTAAPKNSLTPLSDGRKKDEPRPCKTHLHTKNLPLGSPCETTKHHLETSPNQPKPRKERWNSTVQNAPPHRKPTSRQPMRHSQTPPRHEPKPAKSAQKLSNAAFWCPKERWTSTVQRTASLGLALEAPRGTVQHASETGKPQQDSSPTSQTRSAKKLSNATFWWPKERWRKANATAWQAASNC